MRWRTPPRRWTEPSGSEWRRWSLAAPAQKTCPPGFPWTPPGGRSWSFLQHLGPMAAQRGLTIAIEPINRQEANIVTLASEGLRLAREVNHPQVQLLVDYYHLMMEKEDFRNPRRGRAGPPACAFCQGGWPENSPIGGGGLPEIFLLSATDRLCAPVQHRGLHHRFCGRRLAGAATAETARLHPDALSPVFVTIA